MVFAPGFQAARRRRKCWKMDAGVGSKLPAGIGCGVPSEEMDDWINKHPTVGERITDAGPVGLRNGDHSSFKPHCPTRKTHKDCICFDGHDIC